MDFFSPKTSTKSALKSTTKLVPWNEKYRPQSINEIAHQNEVVSVLKKCLLSKDLPNLLFYGPPGTGKTSLILAVAHQFFGPIFRERVLELNASDERGIQIVREKVKKFAQYAVSTPKDHPEIPPFKLIILDEADSMTIPAQAALRRIMETELKSTRFCLTCNYVSRIIDPIKSRCAKFKFNPLDEKSGYERLKHVSISENIKINDQNLRKLLELSQGDMRRAITLLQSAAMLSINEEKEHLEINEMLLNEIFGIVPDAYINNFYKYAKERNIDKIHDLCKELSLEGFSSLQLIIQLQTYLINHDSIKDINKAAILKSIAILEQRVYEGSDQYLQLLDVGRTMVQQLA